MGKRRGPIWKKARQNKLSVRGEGEAKVISTCGINIIIIIIA